MSMKLSLLDFGELTADPGWFFEGSGAWTHSNGFPSKETRRLKMIGAVIEHPKHGVVLYECGPANNYAELWPAPVQEVFAVTKHTPENTLEAQLNKAGYALSDVKAIVIGHMHLDHAGGIENFRGSQIPIYVHEIELKYAFYAVATKEDFGAYLPHYIDPSFNWKVIKNESLELFDGVTFHRTPGHTPGLIAMEARLKNAGTFIFTSDTFFFSENFNGPAPIGWLVRDMNGWRYSLELLQTRQKLTDAHMIFGHDPAVFEKFAAEKVYD